MRRDFILYLIFISLASLATGIQLVMIPWLAADRLALSAEQVGWVQCAQLIPGAMLLLWSGAFADRRSSTVFLPWAYIGMLLCHAALLWLIVADTLLLSLLMIYGALLGAGFAVVQPLRDRLLPALIELQAEKSVQHGVVQVSMCVYISQALGVILAGQMEVLGLPALILLQCLCLLLAALLCLGIVRRLTMKPQMSAPQPQQRRPLPTVRNGLRYINQHRVLRALILLVAFNGFINLGVYLVAMPLLVRDVYRGDAELFSALQLLFVCGSIVATIGILRRGNVEEPGRALLFCLLYSALIMLALSAQPTSTGLLLLVFGWGVIAGVSSSMGKALLQQQVDDRFRGRLLSIYFLSLLGSAPLGALACGYIMELFGASRLFLLGASVSLLLFLYYLRSSALWVVSTAK